MAVRDQCRELVDGASLISARAVDASCVVVPPPRAVRRIAWGELPNRLMKARRMRSGSPKPTEVAIASIGSRLVSTRAFAASARNRSIAVAGVSPVASWKARPNCRGLRHAMLASRSTVKFSAKCTCANWSVRAMRSDNGSRDSISEYWDWPPRRRKGTTRCRATARARSGPWSSSISAKARSIPAVAPADDQTDPSCTKIRSDSTCTDGKERASCSASAQCVVARRPSSSPVRASKKAPVHTLVTRLAD